MAKDRISGKLTVILHADIAGSTELVQRDEHLAHERIQEAFRRCGDLIERYHGKVLELRGDALLAEFGRPSDAVSAAISFQADHAQRNTRIDDDLAPMLRVGIAMGEVIVADRTVTGAGVVLAQRVEQLALPGGLCITEALHEALPKRMPFDLESLGEQALKGFDDPVRVYRVELRSGESIPPPQRQSEPETSRKRWIPKVAAALIVLVVIGGFLYWSKNTVPKVEPASVERMAFPLPDKPSIAVLPFTNMSGDAEQEFFVDGMTDNLITDLSKVPELFVIARNSVFTYKGKAVKIRQVAEELGVRYVIEGSVQRAGNQVRVNAQLIDSTTGGHVWAERYDGSIADVFALQDSVTRHIVGELQLKLVRGDSAAASRTLNTAAYDSFLKGWAHYQRRTVNDLKQALPHLERAIQLDGKYAQAHAALAAVYWETWQTDWGGGLGISREDAIANARAHLAQAMREPSPLAHWVAANLLIAEGNYQAAVTEAKQIVALDTNNAEGYAILAKALTLSGQTDESEVLIEKAVRLDPYSSPLHTATHKGDVNIAKRLVAEGVNVDGMDYYGKTPLHIAAENGHEEIAALLIEAGAELEVTTPMSGRNFRDFGSTPLILATVWGHTRVAELLIDSGADANAQTTDAWGQWTALHYAVRDGREDIAGLLVSGGADIHAKTGRSLRTPLFEAIRGEHESIVQLLISAGANVNAKDWSGSTPLHLATISGNYDIVSLLLANGADVGIKTISGNLPGQTPLHATAYKGNTQITELLLVKGADVDARDQNGYTPLRRAVDEGRLAMAELLVDKGADIATRDKYGITPLHVVAQTDRIAIAEFLIAGGADVNAKDSNSGLTPLDYAQDGDERMIKILKEHGAICTSC